MCSCHMYLKTQPAGQIYRGIAVRFHLFHARYFEQIHAKRSFFCHTQNYERVLAKYRETYAHFYFF